MLCRVRTKCSYLASENVCDYKHLAGSAGKKRVFWCEYGVMLTTETRSKIEVRKYCMSLHLSITLHSQLTINPCVVVHHLQRLTVYIRGNTEIKDVLNSDRIRLK